MSVENIVVGSSSGGGAIDARLTPAVGALEASDPALRVISARVYRVPYARVRARLTLQSPRRFNVLEEFIVRAALELDPPPTAAELSTLLGLDPLFVDGTVRVLEELKTLARRPNAAVVVTPLGRQFFDQGLVPQPPEHKPVSLLYLGALDELRMWKAPTAVNADLPALPGLAAEREALARMALAAVTAPRVSEALAGDRLRLLADNKTLTAVDQAAVEDLGFYGCGVLVAQNLLAPAGEENLALRVVDLETQALDEALGARLDEWLAAGRVKLSDFVTLAAEAGTEAAPLDEAEMPEYVRLYREQVAALKRGAKLDGGVELLSPSDVAARGEQLRADAQHTLLLLMPRLTEMTAGAALWREISALAARGVLCVVGWGTADEREQEPHSPYPGVIDALNNTLTPEGIPAAPVWWVGRLYGQDVVIDYRTLVSRIPAGLTDGKRQFSGSATYVVTVPELVKAAVEDLEPTFAHAARQSWHAAVRSPVSARLALERCCVTWVAIRRPAEALSHVLKLAADEPEAIVVAWELLTVTNLALARLPESELMAMGAPDGLRRSLPEFLDWADSAAANAAALPTFVVPYRTMLGRYVQGEAANMAGLLADTRKLWAEMGLTEAGRKAAEAFVVPEQKEKKGKPKKRWF